MVCGGPPVSRAPWSPIDYAQHLRNGHVGRPKRRPMAIRTWRARIRRWATPIAYAVAALGALAALAGGAYLLALALATAGMYLAARLVRRR